MRAIKKSLTCILLLKGGGRFGNQIRKWKKVKRDKEKEFEENWGLGFHNS